MVTHADDLSAKARLFTSLHRKGDPLLLVNAWDVASARVVAAAGAHAVATTSAGVAWTLGAPDGDQVDRVRVLDLVARIAAAVPVPVTADIESGYAADPDGVADTIRGVLDAGAVGVNLEDTDHATRSLRDVRDQCERIAAARRAAEQAGVELYLNARADVFFHPGEDTAAQVRETLQRATAYLEAGASGIFVPAVRDPAVVGEIVAGIDAPVNILAGPGAPPVRELAGLGVARVSVGHLPAAAAYAVVRRATEEVLGSGSYGALADALPYSELNAF